MRYKTICPLCSTIRFQRTLPKCFQGGGCNQKATEEETVPERFQEWGLATVESLEVQQATE
jgi:hypothetical protein